MTSFLRALFVDNLNAVHSRCGSRFVVSSFTILLLAVHFHQILNLHPIFFVNYSLRRLEPRVSVLAFAERSRGRHSVHVLFVDRVSVEQNIFHSGVCSSVIRYNYSVGQSAAYVVDGPRFPRQVRSTCTDVKLYKKLRVT